MQEKPQQISQQGWPNQPIEIGFHLKPSEGFRQVNDQYDLCLQKVALQWSAEWQRRHRVPPVGPLHPKATPPPISELLEITALKWKQGVKGGCGSRGQQPASWEGGAGYPTSCSWGHLGSAWSWCLGGRGRCMRFSLPVPSAAAVSSLAGIFLFCCALHHVWQFPVYQARFPSR